MLRQSLIICPLMLMSSLELERKLKNMEVEFTSIMKLVAQEEETITITIILFNKQLGDVHVCA